MIFDPSGALHNGIATILAKRSEPAGRHFLQLLKEVGFPVTFCKDFNKPESKRCLLNTSFSLANK